MTFYDLLPVTCWFFLFTLVKAEASICSHGNFSSVWFYFGIISRRMRPGIYIIRDKGSKNIGFTLSLVNMTF